LSRTGRVKVRPEPQPPGPHVTFEIRSRAKVRRTQESESGIRGGDRFRSRGEVHTNRLENHLFRYLDEQVFRYNNRKMNDDGRCHIVVRQIVGKRLTWDQLTGKQQGRSSAPLR
jgi:hypothetical protein